MLFSIAALETVTVGTETSLHSSDDPLKTSLNVSNRFFVFAFPSSESYIVCQGSCSSPTFTMRFCSASDGAIMELAGTVWGVRLSEAGINAAVKALDKPFILLNLEMLFTPTTVLFPSSLSPFFSPPTAAILFTQWTRITTTERTTSRLLRLMERGRRSLSMR